MPIAPFKEPSIIAHSKYMADSYFNKTKTPLIKADDLAHALYHAPFVLIAHGVEEDPVYYYANLTAQRLWGMTWREFTRLPSRLSAEASVRKERDRLLAMVAKRGYIDHYSGVRITKDGRRFRIGGVTVWNVSDDKDVHVGQAAAFSQWEWL